MNDNFKKLGLEMLDRANNSCTKKFGSFYLLRLLGAKTIFKIINV